MRACWASQAELRQRAREQSTDMLARFTQHSAPAIRPLAACLRGCWLHTGSPRSPQVTPSEQAASVPGKEGSNEQEILDLLSQSRLSSPVTKSPLDNQQVRVGLCRTLVSQTAHS